MVNLLETAHGGLDAEDAGKSAHFSACEDDHDKVM